MGTVMEELSSAMVDLVSRLQPAVVGVGRGGSGLVVAEGIVLTNAHNVHTEEPPVTFADGRQATGRLLGADGDGDLAAVAVDTGAAPVATFSEGSTQPGSLVVALANPGGRGVRASLGVVSSVGVSFRGPGGRVVSGAFEHTAPLARGSSGGPVLDVSGAVVGIDTHRIGEGFYLAVPADDALRQRLESLRRGEVPRRPRLGVALAPAHVARRLRRSVGLPERSGLLVQAVDDAGPAAGAGIAPGDLIVRVGGSDVTTIDELADALVEAGPGGAVAVGLVRGADERTVTVDLPAA